MGKWAQYGRRFCPNWEREDILKHWIRRVPGDDYHAFCIYCKCEIRAHHSDLVGHMKSAKHRRNTPVGMDIATDIATEIYYDINAASSSTPRTRQFKSKVEIVTFDVFVGNLPKDIDEVKLERIYSKFGIVHNTWFNNCNTGSRFGIVKFYNEQDALKAVEETNGWILEGNKLVVNLTAKSESAIKKEVDVNDNTEQSAPPAKQRKSAPSNGGSLRDAQSPGLSLKVQEDDFKTWTKKAQDLSKIVKNLRIQFPLDKESVIDSAIALIQSPSKIDSKSVPSLKDTTTCVDCYKNIQTRIMQSPDKNNLKSDIQARDNLKNQLLSKLADTNKELDHLPLQMRHNKIQDVLTLLTKHFDTYIKQTIPQPLENDILIFSFEDWKMKKKDELMNVRKNCDRLESSINTALELLKLSVSINPESVEEDFEDNLSRLFKNYAIALEQEVSKMKIENSTDGLLIASLVQFLTSELKEEFNCLDSLCKTQLEFTAFYTQLKLWINKTPSLTQLKALKNKLKNLKSKLRHKLADKLDAEENHDMVSVVVVIKELEDIRSLIQKTLEEEDNFLAEFSELVISHFPELMTDEFAEDLNTFSTYKGIVKVSHSPEHYTLTTMSNNSGWFTSSFNEEPVLIKEYFLGSANKLSKAEFLSQLGIFSKVSSFLIEPIQAIFFDKDCRHAYMRIKKHGMFLSDKTNIESLSKQLCHSIVKSLALALLDLHQSNLTHGQLHPDFIIVDDDGRTTILPPDFSMSLTDRCKSKYVTKSGLEIVPPEIKQNKIKGSFHAVDVYCLGLIALWLNHPNAQFFNDSGAINITLLSVDPSLYIFLKAALNPNPLMRPSIEKCLMFKYLSTTFP